MISRAAVGLGDLLRTLDGLDGERARQAAAALGYAPRAKEPQGRERELQSDAPRQKIAKQEKAPETPRRQDLAPVPFWRPVRYERLDRQKEARAAPRELPPLTRDDLRPSAPYPARKPIVPWSRLWPALLPALRSVIESREIDIDALVDRWAEAEIPTVLPRRSSRRTSARLIVLVDFSFRLKGFREDQLELLDRLELRLGEHSLRELEAHAAMEGWPAGRESPPSPEDVVLAVSDLGAYGDAAARFRWRGFGRQLRRWGIERRALVPCPRHRWRGSGFELWQAIDWSSPGASAVVERADESVLALRCEKLLRLLSPAEWAEPGLLREVRHLLPESDADLGTEADAWSHRDTSGSSWRAWILSDEAATLRRREFLTEPPALRRAVAEVIRSWHERTVPEIWLLEAQRLIASGAVGEDFFSPEQVEQLVRFIARHRLPDPTNPAFTRSTRRWVERHARHLPADLWRHEGFAGAWRGAWKAAAAARARPGEALPPGLAPTPPSGESAASAWRFDVAAGEIRTTGSTQAPVIGSPLATLESTGAQLAVSIGRDAWSRRYELETGLRIPLPAPQVRPEWAPDWASRVGQDRFGRWADLRVGEVVQRFRWIEPGTFWMGSRDGEKGRHRDEGPRHRVTLNAGFWLGDTPCTQALWLEVVKENPSRFRSLRRPVEQVSWQDTQGFFEALEALAPGFEGRLPSEAEWEYACRAGTATATYAGDLEIRGQNNAPILDEIAWYGGNSGHGFELEEGADADQPWWLEKQYDFDRAGSREVATRRSNAWGLYDMLGNVWEWCQDWHGAYEPGEAVDPDGPERGASRVVRGGSWNGLAQRVRAAARDWYVPSYRYRILGFRLSRGQEPARAAEPQQDEAADGGAPGEGRAGHPSASRVVLLTSDVERVELQAFERPEWAAAAGRDTYGLWASFEVEGVEHRLRWIPPGRFLMGSPEGEEGRFDREGPQHLVTLTSGYWLGETSCPQGLWQAVTGENPSEFKSAKRPVEQVSWHDCREFCERLGELAPGLDPRLPSEAEWEHACRAGTRTATWRGDLEILGLNNAPLLDGIAWYGGNSGHEFDLESGWDSADWPDKQYDHHKAGTREVRLKAPNPWGLYDMLGNVWEWCADGYAPYGKEPSLDPAGPAKGTTRVIRGGSWDDDAQDVRAAARDRYDPAFRLGDLGFRLSRGPAREGRA